MSDFVNSSRSVVWPPSSRAIDDWSLLTDKLFKVLSETAALAIGNPVCTREKPFASNDWIPETPDQFDRPAVPDAPSVAVGEPNAKPDGNTDVAVTELSVDARGVSFTESEGSLFPTALVNTTVQVYSVPLVSPVTATGTDVNSAVLEVDPAVQVAVPLVMTEPPSLG
jgi:hypothetical protein